MKEEFNYPLWLHGLDGIGNRKIYGLLEQFENAKNIYHANEKELLRVKEITNRDKETILYRRNPDEMLKKQKELEEKAIRFISIENDDFPYKLRMLSDAPYGIYVKGKLPGNDERVIAMVGARMCTPYGKSIAEELAYALGECGISVISGMARGIDAYSHKGCLNAEGVTYAVLAGGNDVIYPPEHRELYHEILKKGGIFSEYPPGTEPLKGMFPLRNRLISAFSDGVILVEAKERSGSLITADFALEQGKDIFVVPGRIGDPLSAGCNGYIKQGADIIESIPKFIRQLGIDNYQEKDGKKAKKVFLEKEESIVYSCLRLTPCSVQELITETKLDLSTVIRSINRLEEKGLAEEYYKNYYIRST